MVKKTLGWAAYLAFLFVFFEITFRVLFNIPQFIYMLPFDDAFEVKWYYWWVDRYKNQGVDIYFSFDDFDEEKGWITKPNLTDHPSDVDDVSFTTNSNRLRMLYDVPFENEDGQPRILVLGDSFTFGENVNDDEVYTHLLDEKLPDYTVINGGIHGYGHDQILLHYQDDGVKYNPDIVILGFISNDVARNVIGFRDFAKPKFELEDGELVLTNVPVPKPSEVIQQSYYRSRTVDVGRIFYDIYRERTGRIKADQIAITSAILDEMVETTLEMGATPMFVFMPWGDELTAETEPLTEWEGFLLDYCETQPELHCMTLRPDFAEGLAEGIEYEYFHWKAAGNQTAADGIYDYLIENELVPK